MSKNLLRIVGIALVLIITHLSNLDAQENYYYAQDQKVSIKIDSQAFSIKIVPSELGKTSLADIGLVKSDLSAFATLNTEYKKVSFTKNKEISKLKNQINGIIIPAIRLTTDTLPVFLTGNIIVKPLENSDIKKVLDNFKVELVSKTNFGAYILKSTIPENTIKTANQIHESKLVKWAAPDFFIDIKITADPLFQAQHYLHDAQNDIDINAPQAWAYTKGSNSIRVAVLDNGVEAHEDYAGRLLSGFTPGSNNTLGAPIDGTEAHGTHVTGIIAATHDNGLGIKGIAPNVNIVPVKLIGGTGYGYTSAEIATAITWAYSPTDGNADVLSNSWGVIQQGFYDASIAQAISDARTFGRGGRGCPVIFASGNENSNLSGVTFPANLPGVITVGAIDAYGGIYNYSSRGNEMDLVAVSGGNGLGTVVTTDRMGVNGDDPGNYTNLFNGTSAACPQVSGVAALMLSVAPDLTESQVGTFLQQSARDLGPSGFDTTFGYGLLDAGQAVQSALNTTMHIEGRGFICDGEVYSIANLPAGATVSWSIPSSAGSVLVLTQNSPSTNQLTITNQKWYTINTVLSATVTIGSSTQTITRSIQNDNQTSINASYTQDACWAGGVYHPAQSGIASSGSSTFVNNVCEVKVSLNLPDYKTVKLLAGTPVYWHYAGGTLFFSLPLNSGGTPFTFRVSSLFDDMGACNSQNLTFFSYSQNGTGMSFVVAPNPVEKNLNVSVNEGYNGTTTNSADELTTKSGEVFKKSDF